VRLISEDNEFYTATLELLTARNEKRLQFRELNERMIVGAVDAISLIHGIINNAGVSPAIRLQASARLLELYIKFRSLEGALNEIELEEMDCGQMKFDVCELTFPSGL
jgi:hypothetical protein